jgi:hypothetical protein
MGQIIPRYLLEKTAVTARLNKLEDELRTLAAHETNTSPEEWVVRDALPATDFGHTDERWVNQHAFAVANAWEMDWRAQLAVNRYAMFYGINQNVVNPSIYGIRFRQGFNGATTLDSIHFRKLLEEDNVIGYFDRLIYRPQAWIFVDLIANALTAIRAEEFEILTMICEKYGDIVSGPKTVV